jgi:hypothetical protein
MINRGYFIRTPANAIRNAGPSYLDMTELGRELYGRAV